MFTFLKRHKKSKVSVKVEIEQQNEMEVIDQDLQSILKPLNLMLALFLCSKYKIRNDIITAHNLRYGFFSLLGLFIVVFPYFYALRLGLRFALLGLGTCAGLFWNYYLTIKHRHSNVLLLLKLQSIHQIFKIHSRKYMKANWAIVVGLNCCFFLWLWNYFRTVGINWCDIIKIYFSILLDLQIIYAARLLNLLRHYTEMWIKVAVNSSEHIGESENKRRWMRKFNSFMDIFDAYQILEKTFAASVSV